jgi:hypothetical protein
MYSEQIDRQFGEFLDMESVDISQIKLHCLDEIAHRKRILDEVKGLLVTKNNKSNFFLYIVYRLRDIGKE